MKQREKRDLKSGGFSKMATKFVNKAKSSRKRTHLPSKMAARTVEVRPVGAWVEPEPFNIHRVYEAVVCVMLECYLCLHVF